MSHILRTTLTWLALWLTLLPASSAQAGAKAWQPAAGAYGGDLATLAVSPDYPVHHTGDGGLGRLEVLQGGSAEPGAWESHGPRGGMAQAMAVSPDFAQDGVAFAGEWRAGRHGDQTGLGFFKSTDEGQSWVSSDQGTGGVVYSSAAHAFAFSPIFSTDGTVFAATWGGLFKSTDGGTSWSWLSGLYSGPPGSITTVAVAPDYAGSRHVLAGGGWSGLYVSHDGGLTWTLHSSVWADGALAYSPNFAQDRVAFAGGSNGVYRTSDRGASWTQVLATAASALAVSPQFAADGTLFAGGNALHTSRDGGQTWTSTSLSPDSRLVTALAISPAYGSDGTLFAGDNTGLYRSNDGGSSWAPMANYPGPAVQSLAISPGWPGHAVLLAGTAYGVYRTADGGDTWELTQGLARLSTSSLALAADERLLLAGTLDHGVSASYSGGDWLPLGLRTGVTDLATSPAYALDGTFFASVPAGAGLNIYRTTDSGATWQSIKSTDYPGGSLAISPAYAEDHTLYLTGQHGLVLRSGDGGDTWSVVGGLPPGVSGLEAWHVALPPNYPADGTLFAAGQGFWRLPPGATTWERAASGLDAEVRVTSLAVSPGYAADRTLLATGRWPAQDGVERHGVFRSTDGGVNWQPAGTGLPNSALEEVAFSPNYPADLAAYVISQDQLYRSLDGGLSWTAVGAPQQPIALTELVVGRLGDVYVGSDLGVWRYHTTNWNIVVNGDFEGQGGWELPETPWPAAYSTRVVHGGRRSMRVGLDDGANLRAYSSARQVVTIPADAHRAVLQFYVYSMSGETGVAATVTQSMAFPQDVAADEVLRAMAAGDAQYLLLLDPATGRILHTLFWELSNARGWQLRTFDLTAYAGQTIKLHFGVYNDGLEGRAGMYVDDVALVVKRPLQGLASSVYLPLILSE